MTNWKNAERNLAKMYQYFGIEDAYRESRGSNFAKSDFDVKVPSATEIKSDSKYRRGGFTHHTLISEIERKYCKSPQDEAVMFSKAYNQRGGYITVRVEFFSALLSLWLGRKTKEELVKLLYGKNRKKDIQE